jgi:hypothetical protein
MQKNTQDVNSCFNVKPPQDCIETKTNTKIKVDGGDYVLHGGL